jgi:hypothetical protein
MLDAIPSASPLDALPSYLDRWAAAHLSCEPADRARAEEGVRLVYATAGLPTPRCIFWCQSPFEIVEHLASASPADIIGRNVKADVFDHVRVRVGTFGEVFWNEVLTAATKLANDPTIGTAAEGYNKSRGVSASIHRLVRTAATEDLARVRVRARHALLRWRGLPRLLPRWNFDDVAVGSHDLVGLGVYEYLHDVLGSREPTQPMRGLWAIAKSAAWMVPHEHVCWLSERPTRLRVDARGRLHSPDGPALQFLDGWSAYAWKGVQVPAWMIEHPEQVTAARINDMFDAVLRDCMIEIMTPERFIEVGAALRVAEDETGVLWRKLWNFRGVTIGSWTAVEVTNGTAEKDGSHRRYLLRVPSAMRTAREAVAWTYGMTADQYTGLQMRT